jgi:hypothetical protein
MASHEEIMHGARLAFLAMSARAVAAAEFDTSDDLQAVRFTVSRVAAAEPAIDVEFLGSHAIPLGGMSL